MISTLCLKELSLPQNLLLWISIPGPSQPPLLVSGIREGTRQMPRNYKVISVCCQRCHQGQEKEKKKLNAFMQRIYLRMWKKDISKQNFFLSAPIYGKYSERLKGFCLLKVLEKKREVKDGITVMKQWLKRQTISSLEFLI